MRVGILCCDTRSIPTYRGDLIQSLRHAGCDIVAIGNEPEREWKQRMEQYGIEYRSVPFSKAGINPIKDFGPIIKLYRVIKEEKLDKILVYQAKAISYGCVAADMAGVKEIYALVAGLGSVFYGNTRVAKVIRPLTSLLYRIAFHCCTRVILQNGDDIRYLTSRKILTSNKARLVNGSGVNLEKFRFTKLPHAPAILFVGRLLKDKGIREYIAACRLVKQKHPEVKCSIVGFTDTNPSSLSINDLQPHIDSGVIEYFGRQDDVRRFIEQCSVFVLPSYFEGTPRSVLEAMAMGRPIVTTDTPGCRVTTRDGFNGYLVPVKNVDTLADRIIYLLENYELASSMGRNSYKMAVEKYDVKKVNATILKFMGIEGA